MYSTSSGMSRQMIRARPACARQRFECRSLRARFIHRQRRIRGIARHRKLRPARCARSADDAGAIISQRAWPGSRRSRAPDHARGDGTATASSSEGGPSFGVGGATWAVRSCRAADARRTTAPTTFRIARRMELLPARCARREEDLRSARVRRARRTRAAGRACSIEPATPGGSLRCRRARADWFPAASARTASSAGPGSASAADSVSSSGSRRRSAR